MLDWDALIPPTAVDRPSDSAGFPEKTGDIPSIRGTPSSLPGIDKASRTKGFRDQSPESPLSPAQKSRTDTNPSGRGVGEGKINCARESIFRSLGDLRTCDLCGNLTERTDAAQPLAMRLSLCEAMSQCGTWLSGVRRTSRRPTIPTSDKAASDGPAWPGRGMGCKSLELRCWGPVA